MLYKASVTLRRAAGQVRHRTDLLPAPRRQRQICEFEASLVQDDQDYMGKKTKTKKPVSKTKKKKKEFIFM